MKHLPSLPTNSADSCVSTEACSGGRRRAAADGERGGGGEEGTGPASARAAGSPNAPLDNKSDHIVSAVSGNGQVVARAVTARNLVQVGLPACLPGRASRYPYVTTV